MDEHQRANHWFDVGKSGLAYGIGMVIGGFTTVLISNLIPPEWFTGGNQVLRLIAGVLMAFLSMGLGGAVAGFIGGLTLQVKPGFTRRWGYALRSALSLGAEHSLILTLTILLLSLLTFYNPSEISNIRFGLMFAVIGALYGGLAGGLMGLITYGWRRFLRVAGYGLVGFALGGAGLGISLRLFIYALEAGAVNRGPWPWLVIGLFLFGLFGGGSLGLIYSRIAKEMAEEQASVPSRRKLAARWGIVGVIIILVIIILRPIFSAVGDLLTPQSADLATIINSPAVAAHWSTPVKAGSGTQQGIDGSPPDLAVSGDRLGLVWTAQEGESSSVMYRPGIWIEERQVAEWDEQVSLSSGTGSLANAAQIAFDSSRAAIIVWSETSGDQDIDIFFSRCEEGDCTAAAPLTGSEALECGGVESGQTPALAVNVDDEVMVVWGSSEGMVYSTWAAGQSPPSTPTGCVPGGAGVTASPRLAAELDGDFLIVFDSGGEVPGSISLGRYTSQAWQEPLDEIGQGALPEVYADAQGGVHAAWCGEQGGVVYWHAGEPEAVSELPCLSRPGIRLGSEGRPHVVWYSDLVQKHTGTVSPDHVLYESIHREQGWTPAVIVSQVAGPTQPVLAGGDRVGLHLAWISAEGSETGLLHAYQASYTCEDTELGAIGRVVYELAEQPAYRSPGAILPYCGNEYEGLIYTPNPDPAFSDQEASLNGAFDVMAELIEETRYEVDYSTMWYDQDINQDSPGSVVAQAVAELYHRINTDPASYPRGLKVRILLGNPPELAAGETSDQVWHAIQDLRNAGVEKMVDEETGWRVEVADFEGALPHSHVKMLVIDGKDVIAAGYNFSYPHYSEDHPSGLGEGRDDLGLHVRGPVAQDALAVFDDLWNGSLGRYCTNFYPALELGWQATCRNYRTTSSHVPEVLRYDITGGDTKAFSMYRSEARDEADQQIISAISAAEESVEVVQVNFTLEIICDLNVLYDVCTYENTLPYMNALLRAAENGADIRVLLKIEPFEGIENALALDILEQEIADRGLSEQIEVRYYQGPVHIKAVLVDDQFLVVGSQNFHYSAFGEGVGLAEYNLGVEDPGAAQDFKRLFDYQWELADQPAPDGGGEQ